MNAILYTLCDKSYYQCGFRCSAKARFFPTEPDCAREWLNPVEYALPEGYTVGANEDGTALLIGPDGTLLPIVDSDIQHMGGAPAYVENDRTIRLEILRELRWKELDSL